MKLQILDTRKQKVGDMELPGQFSEDVRPDLIKRAVLSLQSIERQPYGSDPRAGMKASVTLSKRRRNYRGSYGFGISRTPRKILSRRGRRMMWVGAYAPNTTKGRRAHPPKIHKVWEQKINTKERRKAIRSAIAATISPEAVRQRGHAIPENYPFIVDNIESLSKTKEVIKTLENLGLQQELGRASIKTLRSGRGKSRGRKYKTRIGPLIVVANDVLISKSAKNIPGVDVIKVKELNAKVLAPGAVPGRLTLWTRGAIEALSKEKLFM